jgi:hypothetical protein
LTEPVIEMPCSSGVLASELSSASNCASEAESPSTPL